MRKALLMVGALLALTSSAAMAVGIDLNWNACTGSVPPANAPAINRNQVCTSTTTQNTMVVSYYAPGGIAQLESMEAFVDYQSSQGITCWWDLRASNAPRNTALTFQQSDPNNCVAPDFDQPCWGCPNSYFAGKGGLTIVGGMGVLGNGNGRIATTMAIPTGSGTAPSGGEEAGMGIRFSNQSAPVANGCVGCLNPACFTLNAVNLYDGSVKNHLNVAQNHNTITWQGGAIGGAGCPGATPTQSRTWGSVKALYR